MQPMPPKIRKMRLPKRKASSNAVRAACDRPVPAFSHLSPRTVPTRSFYTVTRAFRVVFSHAVRFPAPFALFSHTAVPISHSVTHTCSYVPSRTVFSHRHALILRTVRARFLAPFPRGRSALVFGRRTFGLCSLGAPSCTATRALLARFTPVTRLFHRLCCIKTEARRLFPRICFRGAYGASVFRYEKFRFPVCRLAQCHEKPLDT